MDSSTWHTNRDPILPESCVMDKNIRSENSWRMMVVGILVLLLLVLLSSLLALPSSRRMVLTSEVGKEDSLGR